MIGERIFFYRKKLKLTQEQLSNGICSVPYLSKVENDKLVPSDEILDLLCKRLGVSKEEEVDSKSITSKLENCLQLITEKKMKNAKNILSRLDERQLEHNPELLTFFYIVSLKFHLSFGSETISRKFYNKLEGLEIFTKKYITFYLIRTKGLFEYSLSNYNKALLLWEKADSLRNVHKYVDNELDYHLSLVYSKIGNYTLSILYGKKAIEIFNDEANFEKVIDSYVLLGINFNRIKEYELAKTYLNKALKVSSIHSNPSVETTILHNLGYVYSNQNEPDEALNYFKKSLDLKISLKSPKGSKLNTIYLIAKEYLVHEIYKEAKVWINRGIELLDKEMDTNYYKLMVLKHQADKEDTTTDFGLLLEKALDFYESHGDYNNSKWVSLLLAKYYKGKYQYKYAMKFYEKTLGLEKITE